ncbi:LysR substrate-binding domain-containing protein (plasmid) [Thioclava sp. 'Guangxiensis']|uniref:LysR family transcriptional regulator n=1 Tax=Thioclava sp. 'Guangxiensis' TaxID=3149044 RepID=UPI0032C3F358
MNLRQLEILRAVVRTRSTVSAAETLGMSQPAVSNAVKAMEGTLGFALFERSQKRMNPTQEALILLGEAELLFRMAEAINQTAAHLKSGKKGRLRIVATSELSETLLPRVLARFWAEHRGVEISLETQRLDVIMEEVEQGVVDIGLAMEPHPRSTLDFEPLAEMEMVVAVHEANPLARRITVNPRDLEDQVMINARTSSRIASLIEAAFRKEGARLVPDMDVRFMNVAGHMVEEGLGITIMDALTATSSRFRHLRAVALEPRVNITLSAITQHNRLNYIMIQSFLRHAKAEIASRGIRVP